MQPMVTRFGLLLFAIMSLIGLSLTSVPAVAETSIMLTRYPYLTDSIQSSITINWATDRTGGTAGSVTWGPAGDCNANRTAATRTSITVVSKLEYQWKATIPVDPDTRYCYRVWLADVDLLGTDSSPSFTSQGSPPARPRRSLLPSSVTGAERTQTGSTRIRPMF